MSQEKQSGATGETDDVQLVERARGGDLTAFGQCKPPPTKGVATGFFDP